MVNQKAGEEMSEIIRIALGSTTKQKVYAVRAAVLRLGIKAEVVPVKVSSGIAEQPVGAETAMGALRRAKEALALVPGADYAVGIENGLFQAVGDAYVDRAVVVLRWRQEPDRLMGYAESLGVEFPRGDVSAAFDSGLKKTAGSFIAARSGCDPADPHSFLTGGHLTRAKLLEDAVVAALAPWFVDG